MIVQNEKFKISPEIKNQVLSYLTKNTKKLVVPDFELEEKQLKHNNHGVMKHTVKIQYTPLQIAEWIKCARDPIYFIEKYCYIISLDEGLIKFKLYPFQKKLIRKYQKHRFNIPMQSRQTGKTTTSAAFILWFSIFHSSKVCAVLANKQTQAQETVERITTMLENLPFFLQPGNKTLNKRSMQFGNGSKIISAATSNSSIRGQSVALLYLDEFAHVQNDVAFFESTYPVITSGETTRAIITSTPNGAKGMFYKLWKESESGKNDYVRSLTIWSDVPGRDAAWAKTTKNNCGGEAQWRQEFLCEFLGSVNSLISGAVLEALPTMNPIELLGDDLKLAIFEKPIENHTYVMTVDTSRGVGGDYSAFLIFDCTNIPYKIVARYKNNEIPAMVYPSVIYPVVKMYNDAFVLIETNDMGESVANILWEDFECESVLYTSIEKSKGQQIDTGFGKNSRLGVKTTKATKNIGCSTLKTLIEDYKIEVNDIDTKFELSTFVSKKSSFEADDNCNDDLAMCCVIFAWFSSQSFFKEITKTDIKQKLIEERNLNNYSNLAPVININNIDEKIKKEGGDIWVSGNWGDWNDVFESY